MIAERWGRAALLLLLGSASAACRHRDAPAASASPAAKVPRTDDLSADDRIAWLLAPCSKNEPFLADTTDMTSILVSKLVRGQLDPLRQAKTELAQMEENALPDLRRLFERSLADPDGAVPILNVLAVLGAMDSSAGHDLLVAGLSRPQDTVRMEAIRGLSRHGGREDYDRLMALVPISSPDVLREIGAALVTADRERYEDDFAAWLLEPNEKRENGELWEGAPERVSVARRPEILAKFEQLLEKTDGETHAYLAACLAASGNAAALADLRKGLKEGGPQERSLVVRAATAVGLAMECAGVLAEDRDESVRSLAARAIAAMPATPETTDALRKGLRDRSPLVREPCILALVLRGDAEARDQGLAMLRGDRAELERALATLRDAWSADPAYAKQALDLLQNLRSGELAPVRVDRGALDRAIAQVPLAAAAEVLYASAKTANGEIDRLSAHRWYLMQAGNTGPAGRSWLAERWAEEGDPVRRVDVAMAVSYGKDDASREFLLEVVDDERSTPLEILYAANLLVHQGPAAVVAPRLKRVALRIADARVRPALNCLLWQWYGE
jgi:hypothetical protein